MQTKNLIQTQANVIRITGLTKGSVVKMVDDSSYSSPEISYAIVIDMMNDGNQTFIELLKYKKSYNSVEAEFKILKGDKEVALFPTTTEEVKAYLGDALKDMEKKLVEKKEEVYKLEQAIIKGNEFVSGEMEKKLTEASFEEISQEQFNTQKALKEMKLKELQAE